MKSQAAGRPAWDAETGIDVETLAKTKRSGASGFVTVLNWGAKLILPLVVIAAGAFGTWQMVSSKPEVNKRPPREKSYAVQVAPATPADHRPDIILYGTVSAARKVDLRALVSGEVTWVNPDLYEGGFIREGQALVRIDPFNYEGAVREAVANLAEAKAKLTETTATIDSDEAALERLIEQRTFATNDLERAERLVQSGSLTKQALENRKLTLSQREQSVEARQNNLAVLKARVEQQDANIERLNWRLEQARRNLENTELKAPFDAVVQARNVELGRSVSGNDTLVTLYDPDQMDVRFTLSDSQYGRLITDDGQLVGRDIKVNWKLGDETQVRSAKIERITPEINASNGGIEVFARIAAESGLRAGTFVELVVPDRLYENAIAVPQAALYTGDILYINNNGRMAPQKVDILAYLGEQVLVDASAFAPDAEIVTTRVAEAGTGLKLAIPGRADDKGAARAGNRPEGAKGQRGQNAQQRGEGARAEGKRPGGRQGERPENATASRPNRAQTEGAGQ